MTPILKVTMGLGGGIFLLVAALLIVPRLQPAQIVSTGPGVKVAFDAALAGQGKQLFANRYACSVCHQVSSAGVSGASVGPDLSRVLLAQVPQGTRPELNPLEKWMKEKGLARPEDDPEKAAGLVTQYLANPPDYSSTMKGQVLRFKDTAGGDDAWLKDVKAIVELLKQAATK
ncbi:MAG: c-type cytochrome [Chloroflexi bacterium]|nr:c-type cytochrome [Chloroflexota bacterium]